MRPYLLLAALLPLFAQAGEPTECELAPYRKTVKVDAMTDRKTCIVMAPRRGTVTVNFLGNNQPLIGVAGESYPGRDSLGIRVDGGKAYLSDNFVRGKEAVALLLDLRTGDSVATQYVPWPSGVRTDTVSAICNLAAAVDECLAEL